MEIIRLILQSCIALMSESAWRDQQHVYVVHCRWPSVGWTADALMDSESKDWVYFSSFLLYKPLPCSFSFFFLPCCCLEFNQSTSEEIKCGESDQHADPGFVLYSPGNGPCEFCRCLIMEQNTRWSRLVPWLQQWVCRHWAREVLDCRASQALSFTELMHKIRNRKQKTPHLASFLMS